MLFKLTRCPSIRTNLANPEAIPDACNLAPGRLQGNLSTRREAIRSSSVDFRGSRRFRGEDSGSDVPRMRNVLNVSPDGSKKAVE